MCKNAAKLCENCNSEVITIKKRGSFSVECSYCGIKYEDDCEDFTADEEE